MISTLDDFIADRFSAERTHFRPGEMDYLELVLGMIALLEASSFRILRAEMVTGRMAVATRESGRLSPRKFKMKAAP